MSCTLQREPECCFLDQVNEGCLCHLHSTRTRLSGTVRPQSHQQPPPLAISKVNAGFKLTHRARASNSVMFTTVTSHTQSTPTYPQQRSLPILPTCDHVSSHFVPLSKNKTKNKITTTAKYQTLLCIPIQCCNTWKHQDKLLLPSQLCSRRTLKINH